MHKFSPRSRHNSTGEASPLAADEGSTERSNSTRHLLVRHVNSKIYCLIVRTQFQNYHNIMSLHTDHIPYVSASRLIRRKRAFHGC